MGFVQNSVGIFIQLNIAVIVPPLRIKPSEIADIALFAVGADRLGIRVNSGMCAGGIGVVIGVINAVQAFWNAQAPHALISLLKREDIERS